MSLIPLIEYQQASAEVKKEFEDQINKNGRITNMKKTLLHALPAYKAYMEWYVLRDELAAFLGEKGVSIFSHVISTNNECLICSTFFRKILIDNNLDPDNLVLTAKEQLLVDYGKQLVTNPHAISQEIYEQLQELFSAKEIVLLTAFAGLMIATNLINTALKVPLDNYLETYQETK